MTRLSLLLTMLACFQSCVNKASNAVQQETGIATLPPVETQPPVTKYKSAFTGQTRAPGARTRTPYEAKMLTSRLERPWAVTSLPDGRLLITEKEGRLRIVSTGGSMGIPIEGLPKVNSIQQGGLLDVIIDPDFAKNRMIYWAFTERYAKGNVTAVAKGKLSADEKKIENPVVIFRALPSYDNGLHFGSRLVFDRDGFLYASTGERSDIETRPLAQDLSSGFGKVIRITKDGKPAPNNPFKDRQGAVPEIYSYGHRNVQGLAIHPETGELWASEMGPKGGDELNVVKSGKNYGWPVITYGVEYSGKTIGQGLTQKAGLEQPLYYWDPVLSPSGMTFYSGSKVPEWKNNLFVCGLSSRHIARLVIQGNRVIGEERLLVEEEQRFRDICEGKDGFLYAVTDEGRLYRIAPRN
jgi:aldose sugar dehydrogenase